MIGFALIAAAMIAVALGWVLVPLLKPRRPAGVAREASNVAILSDQLRELDADLETGAMPREHYEQAKRELEERVLDESKASEAAAAPPTQSAAWTAAILGGAIPVVALLLYVTLGNREAFAPAAPASAAADSQVTPQQIEGMVANLAAKLEKDPNNPEGWVMLARSYYVLNRHADAAAAFERALAFAPDNADLLADYADSVGSAQGGLQGKALALIDRALEADPNHWKALALAGTAAFDRQDYARAVAYWEKMKATVPAGSQIAGSIDSSIAEARALGNIQSLAPSASAGSAAAAAPAATALPPAAATVPDAKTASVAPKSGASVAGTVRLSPSLGAKAAPDDIVYVYARAAEGPRMPLAIMKKRVKDLPISFTLDDTMAMTPSLALSNFANVVVGARITKSGNATPQSGDLEGSSPVVKLGAKDLTVVIDRALP